MARGDTKGDIGREVLSFFNDGDVEFRIPEWCGAVAEHVRKKCVVESRVHGVPHKLLHGAVCLVDPLGETAIELILAMTSEASRKCAELHEVVVAEDVAQALGGSFQFGGYGRNDNHLHAIAHHWHLHKLCIGGVAHLQNVGHAPREECEFLLREFIEVDHITPFAEHFASIAALLFAPRSFAARGGERECQSGAYE